MGKIRTTYVDHLSGKHLVLERDDDGRVNPPIITLHVPLVGEVRYMYRYDAYTEYPDHPTRGPNHVY